MCLGLCWSIDNKPDSSVLFVRLGNHTRACGYPLETCALAYENKFHTSVPSVLLYLLAL